MSAFMEALKRHARYLLVTHGYVCADHFHEALEFRDHDPRAIGAVLGALERRGVLLKDRRIRSVRIGTNHGREIWTFIRGPQWHEED